MKLKKQLQHLMASVFALMLVLPAMAQNSKISLPNKPKLPAQQKNGVYSVTDDQPAFPGGMKNFMKFLSQNVTYPKVDRENNVQGRVVAQFVVEKDGSLTKIKTFRSPSKAMADEAIRVLKRSPKWKPGKVKGKAVRAMYTIPVSFSLSAES
jgi:protein TonB